MSYTCAYSYIICGASNIKFSIFNQCYSSACVLARPTIAVCLCIRMECIRMPLYISVPCGVLLVVLWLHCASCTTHSICIAVIGVCTLDVCVCAYVFVWHKEGKCLNCTVHWSDDAAYRILLYYTAETNGVCKRFWPRTRTFVYLEHKQFVLDIIRVPSVSCGAASTINNKYSSTYYGPFARSIRFDSFQFFLARSSHILCLKKISDKSFVLVKIRNTFY